MNIFWENDADGYVVATLATPGTVLATARTDHGAPVDFFSEWIPEGGDAGSVIVESDGYQARIVQGENAGQGLLVLWAAGDGDFSPEITLMVLGAATGVYHQVTTGGEPPETAQPIIREAPTHITASVSELNRILIDFDPVSWEAEPDFVYRFTFQQNAESPVVLERGWSVLTTGDGRRQLYDELIGLTDENAGEWTVTIQGVSSLGAGDTSAPFVLHLEAAGALVSFSMDNTAQISWVFSDWQNAQPLEVETRIDGGPWVPTFITDKTRTNDELYGDAYVIAQAGNDWAGGVLGYVHRSWPFDGLSHNVEARARIAGSSDEWMYAAVQSMQLSSIYYPELIWGVTNYKGGNGVTVIPVPTFLGRKPAYHDLYNAEIAIDGEAFTAFREVEIPSGYRIGLTLNNLIRYIPDSKKDGGLHHIAARLIAMSGGNIDVIYDRLPEYDLIIPTRGDLKPQKPDWSRNIEFSNVSTDPVFVTFLTSLEDYFSVSVNWFVDGLPAVATLINRFRHAITVPPGDGLQHEITGDVTITGDWTGESNYAVCEGLTFSRSAPKPPTPRACSALLLRQGSGAIVDQIQIDFDADTLVQVVMLAGSKLHGMSYADSTDTTITLENCRKYLPEDGNLHGVKFGVRGYSRGDLSDIVLSAPLEIQALPAPVVEQIDRLSFSDLANEIAGAQGMTYTETEAVLRTALTYIREVVSKGGSVELDYFGVFRAVWKENTRLAKFEVHKAFALGTQQGQVLP